MGPCDARKGPLKENADFVAAMEDVLEVYQRPYDPLRPQVCLDETSKQLTKEIRTPQPVIPGHPAREDSEYERNGTANLFMPLLKRKRRGPARLAACRGD